MEYYPRRYPDNLGGDGQRDSAANGGFCRAERSL